VRGDGVADKDGDARGNPLGVGDVRRSRALLSEQATMRTQATMSAAVLPLERPTTR
jgi:hypothetical protein